MSTVYWVRIILLELISLRALREEKFILSGSSCWQICGRVVMRPI